MRKVDPFAAFIGAAIFLMLAVMLYSMLYRVLCKHGEDVLVGGGELDCTTMGSFTTCRPATRFVCHDEEEP